MRQGRHLHNQLSSSQHLANHHLETLLNFLLGHFMISVLIKCWIFFLPRFLCMTNDVGQFFLLLVQLLFFVEDCFADSRFPVFIPPYFHNQRNGLSMLYKLIYALDKKVYIIPYLFNFKKINIFILPHSPSLQPNYLLLNCKLFPLGNHYGHSQVGIVSVIYNHFLFFAQTFRAWP